MSFKETKARLLELSNTANDLIEMGAPYDTINECIVDAFYRTDEHSEFKTFAQWSEKGYQIIKDSKAFPVWSKPIQRKANNDNESNSDDEDENGYEFFAVAYLFSNAQVKLREVA